MISNAISAIKDGNIDAVKGFVAERPQLLSERDENVWGMQIKDVGLLCASVLFEKENIAIWLLNECNCDPNETATNYDLTGGKNVSALDLAIGCNLVGVITLLLDRCSIKRPLYKNILALLIEINCDTLFQKCIDNGFNVNRLNSVGKTALHRSACVGSNKYVELLLKNGAGVDILDRNEGHTALQIAAWYGHTQVLNILIEAGADHKAVDKTGKNILHLAVAGGIECVKFIMNKFPLLSVAVDFDGRTPLDLAKIYEKNLGSDPYSHIVKVLS